MQRTHSGASIYDIVDSARAEHDHAQLVTTVCDCPPPYAALPLCRFYIQRIYAQFLHLYWAAYSDSPNPAKLNIACHVDYLAFLSAEISELLILKMPLCALRKSWPPSVFISTQMLYRKRAHQDCVLNCKAFESRNHNSAAAA